MTIKFKKMPFEVAAFLADTQHLTTFERGAYLLLLCYQWQHNGEPIPDDEKAIRSITGLGRERFSKLRRVLKLFQRGLDGYWHPRVLKDLERLRKKYGVAPRPKGTSRKSAAHGAADLAALQPHPINGKQGLNGHSQANPGRLSTRESESELESLSLSKAGVSDLRAREVERALALPIGRERDAILLADRFGYLRADGTIDLFALEAAGMLVNPKIRAIFVRSSGDALSPTAGAAPPSSTASSESEQAARGHSRP